MPIPRYKIHILSNYPDTYPNNFKCWVVIYDRKTNTFIKRRGYGKYIGNFAPIWVTINKITKQLTELERENL